MPARPSVETLILECPMPVVETDADHRVRSCNPAFERTFLFTEAEAAGKSLEQLIDLAGTHAKRKDGSDVHVDAHLIPEFTDDVCRGYLYMLVPVADDSKALRALRRAEVNLRRAEEELAASADAAAAAREAERARIALDLHDDVAQRLAALQMGIEQLKTAQPPHGGVEAIDSLSKQTSEIITAIRSLVYDLHPPAPAAERVDSVLGERCSELGAQLNLKVDFASRDVPHRVRSDVVQCLGRIVQEALTNAARHSGTSRVRVRLLGVGQTLHLSVRDYGIGFLAQATGRGVGLTAMSERVSAVGGMIRIASKPDLRIGTSITVWVPNVTDTIRRG
jgi:signal transduction histidine kinase